jgi:hypothetical protein
VVTTYVPTACPVDESGYAQYQAYGDFDPPVPPLNVNVHLLGSVGQELPEVYGATRELVVMVTEAGRGWAGVGAVPETGDVNVLVLPALASCALTQPVGPRAGTTIAPIGAGRVLVVGGDAGAGNATPTTYLARLDTGAIDPVSPGPLLPGRTGASVTSFGDGALLAGGTNLDGNQPIQIDTAEVYSAASGGFDHQNRIQLDEARTHHGAVVLASGQTLLVGGVGQDGTTVLRSLETIDPTQGANEGGLGQLAWARRDPTVLRLASGEVLVAGGFDAAGAPVQTLEWFAPDATPGSKKTVTLAQGSKRAFIALEGGGALAVVTPPDGTPECPAGCTDAACGCFQNVWLIDATGAPEPGALVASELPDPALFGGAGGAPVLWTGARWLQWQPYLGAFGPLAVLDDATANVGAARCSPDPGLALWLDDSTNQLTLLRFDTRNAYSALQGSLLASGPDDTAPDRLDGIAWNPGEGLVLSPSSPPAMAFVTDRTYADVAVDMDVTTGEPAQIALRDALGDELDVGGPDCPTPTATSHVHVERRGAVITWSVDHGQSAPCTSVPFDATARVSVGVRGGGSTRSVAKNLVVTRLGGP